MLFHLNVKLKERQLDIKLVHKLVHKIGNYTTSLLMFCLINAFWPRLSTYEISNNNQQSTWWQREGDFLRLKNIEFGYTLPEKSSGIFSGLNTRIYFTGLNLVTFSKFDLWDTEMGGNGLGYPPQKIYNLGLQVKF